MLGPARDWDVFCAGTGRVVGEHFPGDRTVGRLLAAAERRRLAGYAALRGYLDGPAFRLLGLRLACLAAFRPWERAAGDKLGGDEAAAKQATLRAAPLAGFAARALSRRLERVLEPGDDLADLPLERCTPCASSASGCATPRNFSRRYFPARTPAASSAA